MTERRAGVASAMRWSTTGACVLAGILLGIGCTDSHGMLPPGSTETGNPPVIDTGAVALVVSENAVHVVGEPGAVMPPEGTVEITVVATGKKITGMVNPDGSFDVQVDGTLDDVFEVRIVHDGKSSEVITVMRGRAMVGPEDAGMMPEPRSAECNDMDQRAANGAMMVVASADRSCMSDADCTFVPLLTGCDSRCGASVYVSNAGAQQIENGEAQLMDIACADFAALGCMVSDCGTQLPPAPACVNNVCSAPSSTMPIPCPECFEHEITWRVISPGTLPAMPSGEAYSISGCGQVETEEASGSTCRRTLPLCGQPGMSWKLTLAQFIADPEVQEAMTNGGTYGEPENRSGFVYEVSIDGSPFRYRDCANLSSMQCMPSNIRTLIAYLNQLEAQNPCSAMDCDSPFDPGIGDAVVPAYWHDPASRTCFPRSYSGSGGNGNRYRSLEGCEGACPPPAGPSECAMDRTFVESRCLDCGPIGPCITPVSRCLASCDSDSDCEAEQAAVGRPVECNNGLCELTLVCF